MNAQERPEPVDPVAHRDARLRGLDRLFTAGLIREAKFEAMRAAILAEEHAGVPGAGAASPADLLPAELVPAAAAELSPPSA